MDNRDRVLQAVAAGADCLTEVCEGTGLSQALVLYLARQLRELGQLRCLDGQPWAVPQASPAPAPPAVEEEEGEEEGCQRPRTRGECLGAARPCPWISCRWHLALIYAEPGRRGGKARAQIARLAHDPDTAAEWALGLSETCALDVADRGGITLDEAGTMLGVCKERVRQIEERLLVRLRPRARRAIDG